MTPPDSLIVHDIKPVEIATFRLFPGMSIEVLKNVLMRPLKALILESYGVGNGPDNPEFINTIQSAVDDGIVIVNCTQCRHGCVTQTSYATGTALSDAGVVSGRDMTVEAAIAKLYFLFSRGMNVADIRNAISADLIGELTAAAVAESTAGN